MRTIIALALLASLAACKNPIVQTAVIAASVSAPIPPEEEELSARLLAAPDDREAGR